MGIAGCRRSSVEAAGPMAGGVLSTRPQTLSTTAWSVSRKMLVEDVAAALSANAAENARVEVAAGVA